MTEPLEDEILKALLAIAPDADVGSLDESVDLRVELDIDSMDYLAFVTSLAKRFAVDVPEADMGKLATLAGAKRYLEERNATP